MESLKELSYVKVIFALRKLGIANTVKIIKETGFTYHNTHYKLLPKLEKDGLVKVDRKTYNDIRYELTQLGLGLSLAIENPKLLERLYNKHKLHQGKKP